MLIVEDGTNIAGANTYATLAQARDFNNPRGLQLPADDAQATVFVLQAMDALEAYEEQFAGRRTYGLMQSCAWPRTGIVVGGEPIYSKYIPAAIVAAQCYLVGIATENDISGAQFGRAVTSEKIGPIQTDYSPTQGVSGPPSLPMLLSRLRPFLKPGAGALTSRRV